MEQVMIYLNEIENHLGEVAKQKGLTVEQYVEELGYTVAGLVYCMEQTGLDIGEIIILD